MPQRPPRSDQAATQGVGGVVNPYTPAMQLQDILYSQGFGTRRVCAGLIQQGLVQVYESNQVIATVLHAQAATEYVADGLRFRVQGVDWAYQIGRASCRERV